MGYIYHLKRDDEVIGPNRFIKDGIYIRYRTGGTDTTKARFLFDIPLGLVEIPITPAEIEPDYCGCDDLGSECCACEVEE